LGGIGDKKGLELITATVTNPRSEPALRSSAVKALALSPEGAQELLTLSEGGKFPEELKSTAGSALAMVQFPTLSERIVKAFPPVRSADRKELPPISELVKLKGDAAHGKAVFAKAESSCTLCHRIGETGVDFAPALTEIGSKLGKDAIYDSIINPNAGISMGFETSVLTLKNGQSAMGIVRSETKDLIVLALPGGVTNSFGKNDVKERKKLPTSMMPPGLQMIFSQQDFVDLVEYLSSLKAQTVKK
ncbi:MAG: c-type cytochrome, partial [Verrucomicrobiaceae bacterium]